jgi:hypothetical protein
MTAVTNENPLTFEDAHGKQNARPNIMDFALAGFGKHQL